MATNDKNMTSTYESLRTLSLHERFCLVRDNLGIPPLLCALSTFQLNDKDDLQGIQSNVEKRIQYLLDSVPLLSCFIEDPKATFANFARRRDGSPYQSKDILVRDAINWSQEEDQNSTIEERHALMEVRLIEWQKEHLRPRIDKPLWRVHFIQSSAQSDLITLALSIHHVLTDGRAMINVMAFLSAPEYQPLSSPEILAGTVALKEILPPRNEDVMPYVKASILMKVWLIVKDKLPSLLPDFIRRWFNLQAPWPAGALLKDAPSPLTAEISTHVIMFRGGDSSIARPRERIYPSSVLDPLRANGKKFGIPTIHPNVHTACLIGLGAMLKMDERTEDKSTILLTTHTPTTLRNLGEHGTVSGNFVGAYVHSQLVPKKDDKVWRMSRDYLKALTSPKTKIAAQRLWSLLPVLFAKGRSLRYERSSKRTAEAPTVGEAYLLGKIKQADEGKATLGSLEISNPGMLTPLDSRIVGVSWMQNTSPTASTMGVDVCRWKIAKDDKLNEGAINDGLTISITIQKGIFVTPQQEKAFVHHVRRAMKLLLLDKWRTDITVGQLTEAIEAVD
ncbi:uncharacterized protein FA14DRAFT_177849 [Meira miltonrushii]|uniref:Diacylglycerol O-acyltransferase n=1 Tax=Meira miltonrushii TaxID=1280837 RepID=A0A316VLZ4_9BASI|nr:uncharacterized protein FA14DRAFT_177849 [Meira miltonrushii]PWN38586.1 hypothetical protein FA14DRAFT_177849 [Meira miltonrushii]